MGASSLATDVEKGGSRSWSLRLLTLFALCFVDGNYTVLRRYSQGVLREKFSFNEVLLLSEFFKLAFAVWMLLRTGLGGPTGTVDDGDRRRGESAASHLLGLLLRSRKMFLLAAIYGAGNVLSYVALRRVGAGTFVVLAQMKTLTTALFSSVVLRRRYSWTQWRALVLLVAGVVLFVLPTLEEDGRGGRADGTNPTNATADTIVGCLAETVVVVLSGFASVYFEMAIKSDSDECGIWERNFQLGMWSIPMYAFLTVIYPRAEEDDGGKSGYFSNWTMLGLVLSVLGAMGGLLVALSIKYGDSVLKTLAISGSIVYAALVDHKLLGGPLTGQMAISAVVTIIGILNYTFDATPDAAVAVPAVHSHDEKEALNQGRRENDDVEDGWLENK